MAAEIDSIGSIWREESAESAFLLIFLNVLYPCTFLFLSSVTSAQRIFFLSDLCFNQGLSYTKQDQENGRTNMGDFFPISFRRYV